MMSIFIFTLHMLSLAISAAQAFCQPRQHVLHPTEIPSPYVPWVWDAIVREKAKVIEIVTVSRNACKFDNAHWKQIIRDFPIFANQTAYGEDQNILVPVDNHINYVGRNKNISTGELRRGFFSNGVRCVYVDTAGHALAHRPSLPIKALPRAQQSTVIIRCPLPSKLPILLEMRHLRLEIYAPRPPSPPSHYGHNSTSPFDVCGLEALQHKLSRIPPSPPLTPPKEELYRNLLICTATTRTNHAHLIEWIQYHTALGADQIVLYDIHTTPTLTPSLSELLAKYITDGIVVVVPWPYENCVKGMASGRRVDEFRPPAPIAQWAALSSCYMRYRDYSRWIAHVDDDEFLVRRRGGGGEWCEWMGDFV